MLLEQHPGVSLGAVVEKFVGRGRGGYCFEHATLFHAVLLALGYDATRRLARVGDPDAAPRTHLGVVVTLDGRRVLADPGIGVPPLGADPAGGRRAAGGRPLAAPPGAGRRGRRHGLAAVAASGRPAGS